MHIGLEVKTWRKKLNEKVDKANMVSGRVMSVVLIFKKNVLRLICGYAKQSG